MEKENKTTRGDKEDDETKERKCDTEERGRETDRSASRGDGEQSHPLSARPASTSGGEGGREKRGRGDIGCLFPPSMLQSSFLVSRFMRRLWHHA